MNNEQGIKYDMINKNEKVRGETDMQTTRLWKIEDNTQENQIAIQEAAELIRQQEVIAFPTETVYGLGANATNHQAVAKIFEAKGRPSDNPLIVHVANREQMKPYVAAVPPLADKLIHAFMPGPLTVILPSNGTIANNVTAGLSTVAFRIPDHPVAKQLLESCQLPLAAPSANRSGKPSPTKASHVYDDLYGKIAGILDGGTTGVGLESTVVDCTGEIPIVLRPGGITKEQLEQVVGNVMLDPALAEQHDKPKAPGMKYTHYEPEAPLWLIRGTADFFQSTVDRIEREGKKVAVMCSEQLAASLQADQIKVIGSQHDLTQIAVHLYDALRSFKKTDVDIILCESFPQTGVGEAIMNRLTKAASVVVDEEK
ncbi:L-threonylcarbamoyladenylate synthase [Aquibacillus albus]|uniref:Threonylcarbamoyl-AMP synthase n=2 Tax=Aquibacillus albus TaxID=1168171 RepID=A0ABS2MZG5_9BACI|nr:L-threonylcarbamoyladenylate synthase [Aquibacillus albus]